MDRARLCQPAHQPQKPLYKLQAQNSSPISHTSSYPSSSQHQLSHDPSTPPLSSQYLFLEQIYQDSGKTTFVDLYQDSATGEKVVLKRVNKGRFFTEALKESAYRELELHSRLQQENIVQLFDRGETEEFLIMLMEHVPKHDYFTKKLEELNMPFSMKPTGGLPKLRSFCFDILSALNYLHYHGIMHMDLKPSNLLLQTNVDASVQYPVVKLCDFGLARVVGPDGRFLLPWKCGSDQYRAPEVKDGAAVTPKVDIWSFGIFLHRLSVGFRPHDLGWKPGQAISFPPRHWKKFANTGLQDLIARCLQKDPVVRISAQEALMHPFLTGNIGEETDIH